MSLETVDIDAIDMLAAGGPYLGTGTEKGGDYYTVEDLQRLALNASELAGEVRIPLKLGHSKEQQLLRESGLLDEHGAPAAGWIENVRVEGSKLVGDGKRIPAKLAGLLQVGAFRTRSLEQRGNYTSQRTGKSYEWIVDGLALLGGKAPAVRTLDDIVALYSADGDLPDLDGEPPAGVRAITFDAASISGSRMADETFTLTPEQTAAVAKALGAEPKDLAPEKLLAAIETANKAAVSAAAEKTKTALADAQKKLADAEEKVKALEGDAKPADNVELLEEIKKLSAKAEAGAEASEQLRVMSRDTLIEGAIRGGKLEPALAEQYRKLYDAAPDETKAALEKLPRRDDLFKTYGADGADISGASSEPDEDAKQLEVDYDRYLSAIGQSRDTAGASA